MRLSFFPLIVLASLALALPACQSASSGESAAAADSSKVHIAVPGEHPRHGQASVWESVIEIEFVDGGKAEGHQLRVTYPDYNSFNLMAEDMPALVELNADGKSFRLHSKTDAKLPLSEVFSAELDAQAKLGFKVSLEGDSDICDWQPDGETGQPLVIAQGWQELSIRIWDLRKCPRLTIAWDASGLVIGNMGPECGCAMRHVNG